VSTPRVLFIEGDGDIPRGVIPAPRLELDASSAHPRLPWVMWRLLSGNNRELGRSTEAFSDLDAAISSVVRLRSSLHRFEPQLVHGFSPSSWSWLLLIEGVALARSARSYQRMRECHYSVAGFTEALPLAAILTDPSRVVRQRRMHAAAVQLHEAPEMEVR
jgi:hypothetical protein